MPKNKLPRVAVLGATGAVGIEFVKILEQRKFPLKSIKFLTSSRSAGKTVSFRGQEYRNEELTPDSFKGIDLVLASAGGSVSRQVAPWVVKEGAVMVDNSSAFRMDSNTPLVIPEINKQDIKRHKGIIANPNCSTIVLLVPLYPIYCLSRIKNIVVSTYQSVSGAGARAMQELEDQTRGVLENRPIEKKVFPHQIAFNLFSHNSKVLDSGFNEEEDKMMKETKKILHDSKISVVATCIRVPIFRAHSESIYAELSKGVSLSKINQALKKAPGVTVVDNPEENYFPMPIEASHKDDILVGRIRKDPAKKNAVTLFVSGDQLRKGAALNAIQIAELL